MIFLPQRYLGYENEISQWDTINHSNQLVQIDWTKWLCVCIENKIRITMKEFITLFYVSREWEKDELEFMFKYDQKCKWSHAPTLIYSVMWHGFIQINLLIISDGYHIIIK